jgi:4-hydroxybutyrate CoA-transferase
MMSTATEALRAAAPVVSIGVAPGCATPSSLLSEVCDMSVDELRGCRIYAGYLIDDFGMVQALNSGQLKLTSWHLSPAIWRNVPASRVNYVPLRNSQVGGFLKNVGLDVGIVRVSPPDRNGRLYLGTSTSYGASLIDCARVVIAEVSDTVPRTFGSSIHESEVDFFVEGSSEGPEYPDRVISAEAHNIAALVMSVMPTSPVLQLGLGEVPEAMFAHVANMEDGPVAYWGMVTDETVDVVSRKSGPHLIHGSAVTISAVELLGSQKVFDFAHQNPCVSMYRAADVIPSRSLSGIDRFVSVNTALEVDLAGQVNSEYLNGRAVGGIGGSVDFAEAAVASRGGMQIVALRSTDRTGDISRIVPVDWSGVPVTIPSHAVQFVITEFGIADLRNRSMLERSNQLAAIAHPRHQEWLRQSLVKSNYGKQCFR